MSRPWLAPLAAATIFGILAISRPVTAEPIVHVTNCDTLTVSGRACMRILFTVHNPSPSHDIFALFAQPQNHLGPNDTCQVLQQLAPAGWGTGPTGTGGVLWGTNPDGPPPIHPGQTLAGFGLVLDRLTCCYEVSGQDLVFDVAGFETDCWTCPLAVPARPTTWGRLKTTYR